MTDNSLQQTAAVCVEEIIREQIADDAVLTPETDLLMELAIDSLELVEMSRKIGKKLGLAKKLPIADLRNCTTVGELVQLVQDATLEAQVENV